MGVIKATKYLNKLQKLDYNEITDVFTEDVFYCEKEGKYEYLEDDKLNYILDGNTYKMKDLLRVIKVKDALNCEYEETHILTPRVFAQKDKTKTPEHMNVQSIMFHRLTPKTIEFIKNEIENTQYGKTPYDSFWIGTEKKLKAGDTIYLMNRRVGGWDGSIDRPVIELLSAGGHLPNVWKNNHFETLPQNELIIKEITEELNINIKRESLTKIGGFHNLYTNALVVLYSIILNEQEFIDAINNSKGNIEENTDGMYIGDFDEVMKLYDAFPEYFAGGIKGKENNFTNNKELLKRIINLINN